MQSLFLGKAIGGKRVTFESRNAPSDAVLVCPEGTLHMLHPAVEVVRQCILGFNHLRLPVRVANLDISVLRKLFQCVRQPEAIKGRAVQKPRAIIIPLVSR